MKLANKLIIAMSIVLIVEGVYIYKNFNDKVKIETEQYVPVKITQKKTEMQKWNEKVEKFTTETTAVNENLVLRGTSDAHLLFNDEEYEGKGNLLYILKTKIANLDARELSIDSKFKWGYSYDNTSKLIDNVGLNKITVTIWKDELKLEYAEQNTAETVFQNDYKIFSRVFTPQETAALNDRICTYVHNNLINNTEIRNEAMESLKRNILADAASYGIGPSNINIIIIDDGLLPSNISDLTNTEYN